jgi:hypothetical protein
MPAVFQRNRRRSSWKLEESGPQQVLLAGLGTTQELRTFGRHCGVTREPTKNLSFARKFYRRGKDGALRK